MDSHASPLCPAPNMRHSHCLPHPHCVSCLPLSLGEKHRIHRVQCCPRHQASTRGLGPAPPPPRRRGDGCTSEESVDKTTDGNGKAGAEAPFPSLEFLLPERDIPMGPQSLARVSTPPPTPLPTLQAAESITSKGLTAQNTWRLRAFL